jgi:hypothetical protein
VSKACSTRVREKKCIKLQSDNLKGRNYLGDLGIDGSV